MFLEYHNEYFFENFIKIGFRYKKNVKAQTVKKELAINATHRFSSDYTFN
jgi:hypothetical protein